MKNLTLENVNQLLGRCNSLSILYMDKDDDNHHHYLVWKKIFICC